MGCIGGVEPPVKKTPKAEIQQVTENKEYNVVFTDCDEDNKIKIEVKKDSEDISKQADKVTIGKSGSTRNVKFLEAAEAGSYTITAFYDSQQLAQKLVTIAQKENVLIEKYGYAKTTAELDSILGEGASEVSPITKDVWYFSFKEAPTDGNQYVAIFENDGTKYGQPLWNETKNKRLYIGLADKPVGGFIYEGESWKDNSEDKTLDVEGKTIKLSLYKYNKKVDLAAMSEVPAKKLIDGESIDCSSSVEKGKITQD